MNAFTAARQAAEAAYAADSTHANLKALQAAGKAEMDAVVSAFDARNTAPEPAVETGPGAFARTPRVDVEIVPAKTTRRQRRDAEFAEMRARMEARPTITVTPEMEAAYRQYVSDGLGDTDGYFAPIDRQSFFRINF
jgi:hypothetical protein